MKSSRFQYEYRKSSSKLHKQVGDILRNSLFKHNKIYQEYPVNKINPSFPSGREKFDWYIKDLNLIIEVHGEQHYRPVCFGGISAEEAEINFKRQQFRDMLKRDAAEAVGATYIIVKFDEKINEDLLIDRIYKNSIDVEKIEEVLDQPETNPDSEIIIETGRDRRRKEMEAKKLASEKRKSYRERYRKSEAYSQQKERAKQIRKANYQRAKEFKKNLKRGA